MPAENDHCDLAIIGASAAGLMAAICAGRAAPGLRIVAFDGASRLGVKILVAGGGRCNVTHHEVTEREFAGGSRNAVRNVLRRFDVAATVAFFRGLGVRLKREDTGKLFPVTDDARTVLDALLSAARDAGVELRHPARVDGVERRGNEFRIFGAWGEVTAARVILATGGKALPKSGSDGGAYSIAKSLGHTITPRVFPALVPLKLRDDCFIRTLSGITLPARFDLISRTGKKLQSFANSTLCTHFGLSGPAVMDISRYYTEAEGATLTMCWLPDAVRDDADRELQSLGRRTVNRWLRDHLPTRVADAIGAAACIETTATSLTRDQRRGLLELLFSMPLPITGDRGFTHAEATAGGVPLEEITMKTMGSKRTEGLYLCGELCDVDGRIGGFNFQWAWSSGYVAGTSAAG